MHDFVVTNEELTEWINDLLESVNSKMRQKGKEVYQYSKSNEFKIINEGHRFEITIESANGDGSYEVGIDAEPEEEFVIGDCSCPFFEKNYTDCKHIIAAAMIWKDQLQPKQEKKPAPSKVVSIEKAFTASGGAKTGGPYEFQISKLNDWDMLQFINRKVLSTSVWWEAPDMDKPQPKLEGQFTPGNIIATVEFSAPGKLLINCNCGKLLPYALCTHAVEMLRGISRRYGPFYFYNFHDYSSFIKKVLADYGLTPEDETARQFEFRMDHWGTFALVSKPQHLLKLSSVDGWKNIEDKLELVKPPVKINVSLQKFPAGYTASGILLNLSGKNGISFWIEGLLFSKKKNGNNSVQKHSLKEEPDLFVFSEFPAEVVSLLNAVTESFLLNLLVRNRFNYVTHYSNPWKQMGSDERSVILKHFQQILSQLRPFLSSCENLYLLPFDQKFSQAAIKKITFSAVEPKLKFRLHATENLLELHGLILLGDEEFKLSDFTILPVGLLMINDILFIISANDAKITHSFPGGKLAVHKKEKQNFFSRIVKPLSEKYEVDLNDLIRFEVIDSEPVAKVYLSELNNDFLLIKPRWQYDQIEVEASSEVESLIENGNTTIKVIRKKEEEEKLRTTIRELHPLFSGQRNEFFYLPFADALKGNWFLNFYQKMQELGIPVFGMNELKKFRYNTNKPNFAMRSSSGTDWFDLTIEVTYGDQIVPLSELKKAIVNKQDFILLDDGSLGMLPKEWIAQYSMLLKLGHVKDGNLQLSKFHWTVIDELHEQVDNEELVRELQDKRNRLQNISTFQETLMPSNITATLRDYQAAGFQWLCLLDHLGWGACLADDMGLGKTLQTLSFLLYAKEKYPGETHLIVCPTSLIYNWETEINKFAATLSYHIHYGVERDFNEEQYSKFDLIITSYGMVRSDIEHFSKFKFGYIVLDESQSIKNPSALVTRAVQLLKARNRMVLSGTPVQNNTFDLYAQMNFLNPGMLGSMEFFKSEFANDIDKYGDKEKSTQLRKLIYPFLLRRTKEQVAKDLPDKTETILWCEMDTEQRKIYNSFKDYYRESILQHIAEEGLNKSGIYILEGLLKLRQICDSPALLNEDEKYPNISVKLDELIREVEENTGTHKALIFSQFVGMLHLVEKELKSRKIKYCYLDGSTSAKQRKEVVAAFQEKDESRIFLISLKAGGVGLNLTAADYVYLIDPWWNPAVEQQAIDRTHRIGQTNKIFAYKMICKDTVEEKILSLQQKKKALASDLIADETGFVKKLTKDDVEFLFS